MLFYLSTSSMGNFDNNYILSCIRLHYPDVTIYNVEETINHLVNTNQLYNNLKNLIPNVRENANLNPLLEKYILYYNRASTILPEDKIELLTEEYKNFDAPILEILIALKKYGQITRQSGNFQSLDAHITSLLSCNMDLNHLLLLQGKIWQEYKMSLVEFTRLNLEMMQNLALLLQTNSPIQIKNSVESQMNRTIHPIILFSCFILFVLFLLGTILYISRLKNLLKN